MMCKSGMSWKNGFLAVAALAMAGCSDSQNWNWFGLKKTENKPVTKARKPSDEPKVAAADQPKGETAKNADDPRAREVDDKVNKYVKNMNNTYDPNYEGNDFQSKMRRQNDPNRTSRIQNTAAMSHEGGDGAAARRAPKTAAASPPPLHRADESGQKIDESPPLETDPPLPSSVKNEADSSAPNERRIDQPNPKPTANTPGSKMNVDGEPGETKTAASKPPVLGDIKASAGPSPVKEPTKEPEQSKPSANAPPPTAAAADTYKMRVEEQEARVAKEPNNVEEQFKLRLMYLIDGQDDKALSTTPGTNAEIQDIMQAQLKALISARSGYQRDSATWANKQIEAIENLRRVVRSRADLSVPRVSLCKSIVTYGQYTPFEPADFPSGKPNKVLFYVEVENFSMERTASGQYRVLLNMRQSLVSKAGEELWSMKDDNIEDLSRQPRRDFFLVGERIIPKTLGPGEYVFKVEIEDVLAGKINSNTASFKLLP